MTEIERLNNLVLVRPGTGRLDAAATPQFKKDLDEKLLPAHNVILDASAVEFVDSTGLGAVVGLVKRLPETGKLVIAAPRPPLTRLLQITGLDQLFPQFVTVAEAKASFEV